MVCWSITKLFFMCTLSLIFLYYFKSTNISISNSCGCCPMMALQTTDFIFIEAQKKENIIINHTTIRWRSVTSRGYLLAFLPTKFPLPIPFRRLVKSTVFNSPYEARRGRTPALFQYPGCPAPLNRLVCPEGGPWLCSGRQSPQTF